MGEDERRDVAAVLEHDDRLASAADSLGQLLLGHLIVREAQRSDPILDLSLNVTTREISVIRRPITDTSRPAMGDAMAEPAANGVTSRPVGIAGRAKSG